ncbi:MAG TPA: ParB/RepB/Spo0J family partition protein [Acidimicrobiia bacterium]|nr:ParB/RepB/Spo0J family partition protein [Acidimicrobiia bacterium]
MAAARKSGLGRGLEALLAVERPTTGYAMVAVDAVTPNPRQPRERFAPEALEELAASIREVGVLQPIVVGPADDDGRHVLVAGERRLRAARMAGLTEIPAMIRVTDDGTRLAEALIENVQREDLAALEEAAAYKGLMEDFGMTHEQVAARVGKSRSAITNAVRLLNLPGVIQGLIADGALSAGAARALLGTEDTAYAVKIAGLAATEGWSVRQVEDAIRARKEAPKGGAAPAKAKVERPAQILALEERLSERLGSPVRIDYGARRGGRLTVRFGSVDDLERIYRTLLG